MLERNFHENQLKKVETQTSANKKCNKCELSLLTPPFWAASLTAFIWSKSAIIEWIGWEIEKQLKTNFDFSKQTTQRVVRQHQKLFFFFLILQSLPARSWERTKFCASKAAVYFEFAQFPSPPHFDEVCQAPECSQQLIRLECISLWKF